MGGSWSIWRQASVDGPLSPTSQYTRRLMYKKPAVWKREITTSKTTLKILAVRR